MIRRPPRSTLVPDASLFRSKRPHVRSRGVAPVETAAKPNGWLLLTQRVITLCRMHFPYQTGHEFPLFLAPMSGVSESPFRLLCRRVGAGVVGSGFISAGGVGPGPRAPFGDMRFAGAG